MTPAPKLSLNCSLQEYGMPVSARYLKGAKTTAKLLTEQTLCHKAIQIGYLDPILFQNFRNSTKTGIHFIEPLRPNIRHCVTCVTEHKAKILKGIDPVSTTTNCQTYEKHQS